MLGVYLYFAPMPEQLDLFGATIAADDQVISENPVNEQKPERKLTPPPMVKQEEPVDTSLRDKLKEEALKIARSSVAVEAPGRKPEIREIAKPLAPPPVEPIVIVAVRKEEKEKTKSTRGRKSIKEMSMEADLPEIPEDEVLFSKQYYGIGEVAAMFKVNTSLLRYWESEFDILKPRKNGKGDRFFRPDDIKNLQVIHHLLRQKKFTIEGAKDYLKNNKRSKEKFEMVKQLEQLKRFLLEMKAGL
jgi:DNA-binding transcriptional MerR regulator